MTDWEKNRRNIFWFLHDALIIEAEVWLHQTLIFYGSTHVNLLLLR